MVQIADQLALGALMCTGGISTCCTDLESSVVAQQLKSENKMPFSSISLLISSSQAKNYVGEVLFVIYKLCCLNITPREDVDDDDDNDCVESLDGMAACLLRLALEVLLKTQHDEVRMNCLALLLTLVGRGLFQNFNILGIDIKETMANEDGLMQQYPLITLFADESKALCFLQKREYKSANWI